MLKLSLEIGGRTVAPDDIGTALQDAMQVAVLQGLTEHCEAQFGDLRCPIHLQGLQVFVTGPSLDALTFTLRGCCEELTAAGKARLQEEPVVEIADNPEAAMPPKVFISHASEDKDRFVLGLATRLRARGINAWLDRWEMLPGDSLVDKIFEEGLKDAQAVIVVVSQYSVTKPWVREELNAAFVKRVGGKTKLIPVIIDQCEVPEALQSTVWQRIADVGADDEAFEQIVLTIFGGTQRPPLGPAPAYTTTVLDTVPGLSRADSLVVRALGQWRLAKPYAIPDPAEIHALLADTDLTPTMVIESLQVLATRHYVELSLAFTGTPDGIAHAELSAGHAPLSWTPNDWG